MSASWYLRHSDCFYNVGQFFLSQLICFRDLYMGCVRVIDFLVAMMLRLPLLFPLLHDPFQTKDHGTIEILLKYCKITLGDFFAFSPYSGCIHCSALCDMKMMVFPMDISLDLHIISHQTQIQLRIAFQIRQSSRSFDALTSYNSVLVCFLFYPAQRFLESPTISL